MRIAVVVPMPPKTLRVSQNRRNENFRYKKTEFGTSYCYSTSTTSRNSSFTRGWFRCKAIRHSSLCTSSYKWLGMNDGSLQGISTGDTDEWVLLKLADGFDQQTESGKTPPLTSDQKPVVPCEFDPYLQNIVAPDHCVTGIVKSVIKVCFDELKSADKSKLDSTLVASIAKMGITGQTTIYNQQSKSLNGLSMSTLFALVSVLPSVLTACGFDKKLKSFKLINSFTTLVSLMYWWPLWQESDLDSFVYVHHSDRYFEDLNTYLEQFVGNLQDYYGVSGKNACTIDSPNVHRLIELVTRVIPTYGHCLLIAELPFEAFHQTLKRSLSKNTTKKAHITAMKIVLLGDWIRRVSTLM